MESNGETKDFKDSKGSPPPPPETTKAPPLIERRGCPVKGGGDLLSRIALQYHRRRRA